MFTEKEVLRFVEENDVKFVRLAFCDLLGVVKNVSVIASEMPAAFKRGVKIDAKAIDGFSAMGEEELILMPDPATVSMLPWRPRSSGVIRLFCDVLKKDGAPFEGDGRRILENTVKELKAAGADCVVGTDCQFYLFETDDKGRPTEITLDDAEYLDVAPIDKGEDIRRDICLTLDSLGMEPTTSHHEKGPGQNEIDFKHGDPLSAADNFLVFKLLVKAIGARNGVYATFTPRPVKNAPFNWLNLDLKIAGESGVKEKFIDGVVGRLDEIMLFLCPTVDNFDNGGGKIQINGEDGTLKIKGIDPTANPYLACALLLSAGLEGIKSQKMKAAVYCKDFKTAVENAKNSQFVKSRLPESLISAYVNTLTKLRLGYEKSDDKEGYIKKLYFEKT